MGKIRFDKRRGTMALVIFLVTPLILIGGGQARAEGKEALGGEVGDLAQENKNLKNRLNRVEDDLAHTVRTDEKTLSFISALRSRIDLSGLVEFGGAWQEVEKASGEQEEESDLALTTVELALGAEVNPWVNLETVLLYEDPTFDQEESSLDLDVAVLALGNIKRFPLYLSVGKMYVPFGGLMTHLPDDPLIDSPLPLALGETSEKAVLLGLEYQGLSLAGYTFNGDVEEKGEDSHIDGYGFDMNYSASFPISPAQRFRKGEKYPHGKTTEMDLLVGASYISNIAESDGLTKALDEELLEPVVDDYAGGYAAYLHAGCRGLFLDAEYMSAAEDLELSRKVDGDNNLGKEPHLSEAGFKPAVWNVEAGFNYDWGRNLEVVFKYAGSEEAGGLGFPEERYGIGFNQELFEQTVFSLGYFNDSYENDDAEDRDRRDLIFSQIAVEF